MFKSVHTIFSGVVMLATSYAVIVGSEYALTFAVLSVTHAVLANAWRDE